MLHNFLKPVLLMWCLVLPAWILGRMYLAGHREAQGTPSNFRRERTLCLFVLYIATIFALTNIPTRLTSYEMPGARHLNLVPVINTSFDLMAYVKAKEWTSVTYSLGNIIGNLLLFLPMGVLLPLLFPNFRSQKKILLVCIVLSVLIELIQFIYRQFGTYRTADIDDVILNALGGLLGWRAYLFLNEPVGQIEVDGEL